MKQQNKDNRPINTMRLEIAALSENESFARATVASFAGQLNPTLDEINDIKTAVSEAVTNSVVHAYAREGKKTRDMNNRILLVCDLYRDGITVSVTDYGVGIPNIERAMEPFFTTKPEDERSGMGFTVMQSFMDTLRVVNNKNGGTTVTMQKFFRLTPLSLEGKSKKGASAVPLFTKEKKVSGDE